MSEHPEIPVILAGIALDPKSRSPVIILRDSEQQRILPIWVGHFEANAIIAEREKIDRPRPMTHDLLKRVILSLGATVERLVVTDIRENTFYAELHITSGEEEQIIDCRPSDGIALALRFEAPIFVSEPVLVHEETKQQATLLETDKLSEFIDNISPEDFEEG